MEALSFIVDNEFFAVDVSYVQTVVRKIPVTLVPTAPDEVLGIANFKGRVITILCLNTFLERPEGGADRELNKTISAVIFKPMYGDEDQLGLAIDKTGDLIEMLDEDTKPYVHSGQADGHSCISSIAETNGSLYRIIDLNQISERYKSASDFSHSADISNNFSNDPETLNT